MKLETTFIKRALCAGGLDYQASMMTNINFLPGDMIVFTEQGGVGFLFTSPGAGSEFMDDDPLCEYLRVYRGDTALIVCRMQNSCSREVLNHKLLIYVPRSGTLVWTWSRWWRIVP